MIGTTNVIPSKLYEYNLSLKDSSIIGLENGTKFFVEDGDSVFCTEILRAIEYNSKTSYDIDKDKYISLYNLYTETDNSIWTIGSSLNEKRWLNSGCGTIYSALSFGGQTITEDDDLTSSMTTEIYNGSSWTYTTNLNSEKYEGNCCGNTYATLSFAGLSIESEKFNGINWISTGSMNIQHINSAGCGNISNAICISGLDGYYNNYIPNVERYNGEVWYNSIDLPESIEAAPAVGIGDNSLVFGGISGSDPLKNTYSFDGVTWHTVSPLITGAYSHCGIGSPNNALSISGHNGSTISVITEKFNGQSWSVDSNINIGRTCFAAAGSANNGLVNCGGAIDSFDTNSTELKVSSYLPKDTVIGKLYSNKPISIQ